MEYCCHVWAGAPSCYLELLDKLQNMDMTDCWSEVFVGITLVDVYLNWLNWFHSLFLRKVYLLF